MPVEKKAKEDKLPDYWERIGRAEEAKHPGRLEKELNLLKAFKKGDREAKWNFFDTSIETLEKDLGAGIQGYISDRIHRHSKENPFKVLDLGCGNAKALRQLKDRFKDRINVVGYNLAEPEDVSFEDLDRHLTGEITSVNPHEGYDLIYSRKGAFNHTHLPITTLEKVVKWMKPGGIAILQRDNLNLERKSSQVGREEKMREYNEIKTSLRRNGIDPKHAHITGWRKDVLVFQKPHRKLPD